jgi:hypothetical protein
MCSPPKRVGTFSIFLASGVAVVLPIAIQLIDTIYIKRSLRISAEMFRLALDLLKTVDELIELLLGL